MSTTTRPDSNFEGLIRARTECGRWRPAASLPASSIWLAACRLAASPRFLAFVIAAASLFTRLPWIARPAEVVWDEQHFGRYAQAYFQGKFFFDVQPPLGHLLLFSALKAAHANPAHFEFAAGQPYPPDYPYVAARFLPALAGALLPLVIFLLARALQFSPATGFFAGALVVLDNAILAESHFALIDLFVPFFGFSAILAFLWHRRKQPFTRAWWCTLLAAAAFGALSLSVKWTGAAALAVMGITVLADFVRGREFRVFGVRSAMLCAVAVAVYTSVFAVHLRLLPATGAGDAFMSREFQATLAGSPESGRADLVRPGFWGKFAELNKKILAYNTSRTTTPSDSSRYYEWPAARKRIYLWVDGSDSARTIWLVPNPVVWFFGLDAMLAGIIFLIVRRNALRKLLDRSEIWRQKFFSLSFLLCLYLVNWLPFMAIKRDMYLYHYFSAFLASLLIGAVLVFEFVPEVGFSGEPSGQRARPRLLYGGVLLLAAFAFVSYFPMSYGFHPFLGF